MKWTYIDKQIVCNRFGTTVKVLHGLSTSSLWCPYMNECRNSTAAQPQNRTPLSQNGITREKQHVQRIQIHLSLQCWHFKHIIHHRLHIFLFCGRLFDVPIYHLKFIQWTPILSNYCHHTSLRMYALYWKESLHLAGLETLPPFMSLRGITKCDELREKGYSDKMRSV